MTTPSRRSVGFFPAIWKTPVGKFVWPEGVFAIVVGLGGGAGILSLTKASARVAVVSSAYPVLGVLLGVVFAAFALVVAFLKDDYVKLLNEGVKGGVLEFARPFMIAVGFQITTILVSVAYQALAMAVPSGVEIAGFLIWAFLFAYVLADVVALTREITLHLLMRARQITLEGEGNERTITSIRDRQR